MADAPLPLPRFLRSPPAAVLQSVMGVVERLYDAVGDDEALKEACILFGSSVGAEMIAVHRYDYDRPAGSVLVSIQGFGGDTCALYAEHYSAVNVWMLRGRGVVRPGSVTVSHLLCPDAVLVRSEWYNDFLRPRGIFHSLGCVVQVAGRVTKTVTFLRPRRLGNYTEDEQRRLQVLGPHLQNAFRLHERLAAARVSDQIGLDLLERVQTGAILLGRGGEVKAVNGAAARLLEARDGLELAFGRLHATAAVSGAILCKTLRAALGEACGERPPETGSALVMRPSGRRAYQVTAIPLRLGGSCFSEPQAAAVVFVSDPEATGTTSVVELGSAYHLTSSEAKLAALLAEGLELHEVADRMGVSINTARSHLAHAFSKTGTSRQAELVRLVLLAQRAH
ncbi:MAG: helix-turn-helix transcriptional regulator [Thermoanaerobaculaceae bacterium]|nr:helix-turn-helix transcriptional regulator [Thermoanaerobaculaceae bacterium]